MAAGIRGRPAPRWPFVTPLTDLADQHDSPLPLRQLDEVIPSGHTELRHLALIARTRTMPPPPDDDTDDNQVAEWAAAMITLTARRFDAGHPDTLDTATRACTAYRRLAEATPATHLPGLARSLTNLGVMLSEAGRRDEALPPSQEAVTIRRQLAEANPGTYLPDLAISLTNLGNLLSELGRRHEALSTSQEAVTIYQQLAQTNPATHLPNLAASLTNLGNRLSELGRRHEALSTSQEAVTIYQQLAHTRQGCDLLAPQTRGTPTAPWHQADVGRAECLPAAAQKVCKSGSVHSIHSAPRSSSPVPHLPDPTVSRRPAHGATHPTIHSPD